MEQNLTHNNNLDTSNLYKECKIIREKHTKSAHLEINIPGEWSLFSGNSMDSINLETPIAQGKDIGTYPLYIQPSKRSYFKLITQDGSAILAEKHLPMNGGYNFRDLGGLESSNGKHVVWGKLFRSDDLFNLTEEDLSYLSSIPVISIVDFRCKEEYTLLPDKFPESLKNYYNLSIDPGSLQAFAKNKFTSKNDVTEAMKYLYKLFVTEPEYINTYKKFFDLVQDNKELPLLFHCSAGKDRTGMAAALFLFALDVPREIIMKDYMASNIYLSDKYQSLFEKNPVNKYLYTTLPEYLETALNEIDNQYGSINNFFSKKLKINIEKLKEKFLF